MDTLPRDGWSKPALKRNPATRQPGLACKGHKAIRFNLKYTQDRDASSAAKAALTGQGRRTAPL